MKILVVPNYSKPEAVDGARRLTDWLEHEGLDVTWAHDKKIFPDKVIDISFLTCGAPENLIETVSDALSGELHASHRATLDVEVDFERPDGSIVTEKSFALNDLSLTHGVRGDMIVFDVSVSGHHVDRLRGDGFVVSTSTGSTGYALAAGGPIVTPEFAGMVCVPVACHTIMARAFLTSPSDVVELRISRERHAERLFFADGQPLGEGLKGIRARVRRGPGDVILLDRSARSFYESVSRVFYGRTKRDD